MCIRDSYNHNVIDACHKANVRFSVTAKLHKGAIYKAIDAIRESDWVQIPYFLDAADVAEIAYQPFGSKGWPCRLIVRRVRPTPGSQLALFTEFSYHAFVTDRSGEMLELEQDHRRHADIENTIRDLKYGVGLNHLPSGRFCANAAWMTLNVIAHNLARFTTRIEMCIRDRCCRGPVEFDLAHVPEQVSVIYPGADRELLAECRILVLAMVAAWRWSPGDQFPNGQRAARQLVSALREGPPVPALDVVMDRPDDP